MCHCQRSQLARDLDWDLPAEAVSGSLQRSCKVTVTLRFEQSNKITRQGDSKAAKRP